MDVELELNGRPLRLDVAPNTTLLGALRSQGSTEVKYGCGEGVCGTCTVLLDGEVVSACLMLAVQAQGARVTTVKGLGEELRPLRESFAAYGAVQCGFCIPGMLLTAHELLRRASRPDRAAIRAALEGNLCRCTGYTRIVDAIEACCVPADGSAAEPGVPAGAVGRPAEDGPR